jgi:cytochrome c peroxidase
MQTTRFSANASEHKLAVMLFVLFFGMVALCGGTEPEKADSLLKDAKQVFQQLPKDAATKEHPIPADRVELGRQLFFDPRLSVDGTVSCSRCHLPALYGTDGLAKAQGVYDRPNDRRAPTVLNAALQFKQHWRGDRDSVEDQARQAFTGHASFGNADDAATLAKLQAIPGYEPLFRKGFAEQKEPLTLDHLAAAIGAYERTLITPSRFDEYLGGKSDALSAIEQRGLRLFMNLGCADCHSGALLGGNSFEKFGVDSDYWKATNSKTIDRGRFDVTKKPEDMYVFKVAPLRNVATASAYFHDGSVAALPDAVRVMAHVQLDTDLATSQVDELTAFLRSLTGSLPENFREAPILPNSNR